MLWRLLYDEHNPYLILIYFMKYATNYCNCILILQSFRELVE